jgi:NAD(P)-dependent dehydrogenase (short-subunit alcohol dehydrogenase family)
MGDHAAVSRSYVVTGGGRGVGRAIVERLLGTDDSVVVIELDPAALDWVESHAAGGRVIGVVGSAAEQSVTDPGRRPGRASRPPDRVGQQRSGLP